MSSLWQTVSENVVFVLEFLALIVVMFLIAYVIEKAVKKKNSDTERVLATRKIVVIGVFSAIAAILMVLEFPVPFAPSFYGLDFSELPALIGAFAYGPVAGVMIEFCKILIKLVLKPSSTAFVGERKLLHQLHAGAACVRDLPVQKIEKTGDSRHRCGYTDHDGVWLLLQCHLSASEIF